MPDLFTVAVWAAVSLRRHQERGQLQGTFSVHKAYEGLFHRDEWAVFTTTARLDYMRCVP